MNPVELRLIGIAALLVALLVGAWALVENLEARGASTVIAERQAEHATMAAIAASAAASTAAAEARTKAKQEDALNDAKKQTADAVAARIAGDARARSWRMQLDALAAAPRGDGAASAPAAAGSAPEGDPIGVLAQVLREADSFADGVAIEADANRTAGQLCERSYDALTPTPTTETSQ